MAKANASKKPQNHFKNILKRLKREQNNFSSIVKTGNASKKRKTSKKK